MHEQVAEEADSAWEEPNDETIEAMVLTSSSASLSLQSSILHVRASAGPARHGAECTTRDEGEQHDDDASESIDDE